MMEITSFLRAVYAITRVPIHYYQNGELCLVQPDISLEYDPVPAYIPFLKSQKENILYYSTNEHLYYGIVKSGSEDIYIILGPMICTLFKAWNFRHIMNEAHIAAECEKKFEDFVKNLPRLPHSALINLLVLLYRELNREDIAPEDINNYGNLSLTIHDEICNENMVEDDNTDVTRYFEYEKRICGIVESGDEVEMGKTISTVRFPPVGRLADTEIRQAKNVFIITSVSAARAAIAGGADVKNALELCNHYIYTAEKCHTIDSMEKLSRPMRMDFTRQVAEAKIPKNLSMDVYHMVCFIRENTNKPIMVDDVARYIGKSRSLVSRKFKKEMGENLNSYIVSCKLDAARDRLRFTGKPICDISTHFYFSSQSYFQNLFKKRYGVTPNQFRQQYFSEFSVEMPQRKT